MVGELYLFGSIHQCWIVEKEEMERVECDRKGTGERKRGGYRLVLSCVWPSTTCHLRKQFHCIDHNVGETVK
jgi:hypothetical protein